MSLGIKPGYSFGMKSSSILNLAALEPIIDQLLSGTADAKEVAQSLQALGQPVVLDPTEQLRLALRLLECHDDVSNRPESSTTSSRRSEGSHARARVRSPEADFSS